MGGVEQQVQGVVSGEADLHSHLHDPHSQVTTAWPHAGGDSAAQHSGP